jgi:hypothetical protein
MSSIKIEPKVEVKLILQGTSTPTQIKETRPEESGNFSRFIKNVNLIEINANMM